MSHILKLANVPGRDDNSAAVRVRFYGLNRLFYLIDDSTVSGFPFLHCLPYTGPKSRFRPPIHSKFDTVFLQIHNSRWYRL